MLKKKNWIALAVVASLLALGVGTSVAVANAGTTASTQETETKTSPAAKKRALDGAKVYAWNCGSCHSERWPKERSDAEWGMITTHMRVRANMTADQADAVLRYLQDNN